MSRLISDKYRQVQQEYLERFERLRANEEELNRIFIDIYGLRGELTPEVAEKDVTVYRIIDAPDPEQRKMAYVLSRRDEIVSLISYMVGCMLGRYSPYVEGLLFAGGRWDAGEIAGRIAAGARECDFYDEAVGLFLPDWRRHCAHYRRRIFPGRHCGPDGGIRPQGVRPGDAGGKPEVHRRFPGQQGGFLPGGDPQLLPDGFL